MKPFHGIIFGSMLTNIRDSAERLGRRDGVPLTPSAGTHQRP
jgi:hypothetical protein